jgi:hypothetical protein
MARRRRGVRKLETYKHTISGIDVDIYLNTNNSTFEARVEQDGEVFIDKDLNVVKAGLKEYLDNRVDLGWRWIIELELTTGTQWTGQPKSTAFGFSKRKYVLSSKRVNGKYLMAEKRDFTKAHIHYGQEELYYLKDSKTWRWGEKGDEGDLVLPFRAKSRYGNPRIWLEYTDEVWAALNTMQDTIVGVANQFEELIGTEAGYENLQQIGAQILRLLPAPEDDDGN